MGRLLSVVLAICLLGCTSGAAEEKTAKNEPFLDACENCDWVFAGIPAAIPSSARIAPTNEPGAPMQVDGVVRDREGRPAANVIVYAYHTDNTGHYPRDEKYPDMRHGRLRGWARTGADGRYHFDTIRPAGYPNTNIPEHVHMIIVEVGRCAYWIDDIRFDDDPRLTAEARGTPGNGRAGNGIAHPTRDANGVWQVTRDIILGMNIPNYPR